MPSGIDFRCCLMNPGDINSYMSSLKYALLYADKVYTFPDFDILAKMGAEAYGALDELTNYSIIRLRSKIEQQQKKLRLKTNSPRARRKISERLTELFRSALDNDKAIMARWEGYKGEIEQKNKELLDFLKTVDKELDPAIKSGYVVARNFLQADQLSKELAKVFSLPMQEFIPRTFSSLLGHDIPMRDTYLTTIHLWASQAATMTSVLDCPLMTSLPWFMEFLNGRTCLGLVSRWLEEHRAGQEWKRQRLAAVINTETLPDPSTLRLEDILELREKTSNYLGALRTKLAEYSRTIRAEAWNTDFEQEAEVLFEQLVSPAIVDAEKALNSHDWKKHLGRVAGYGAGTASVLLAAHFSSFSESQTLWVLAATLASVLGFDISSSSGADTFAQHNGMVFMIEAKKRLTVTT